MWAQSEARSLFWVSHAGAGSQSFGPSSTAFPGHRQGAGREAGLPGLELAPIWDPGRARRGPLTTCATALSPELPVFNGTLFFLFKDLFYFNWKGGYTERRNREEDLPSHDSLPKWAQLRMLCQCEAKARSLFQVSHMGAGSQSFIRTMKAWRM